MRDYIRYFSYVVEFRHTVVRFMDCIDIYAMKLVKYHGLEILDSIFLRKHVEVAMASKTDV